MKNWLLLLIIWLLLCILCKMPAYSAELALGDSIAVGTGQALGVETRAKVGASSCAIVAFVPAGHYDRAVISAGVNDPPGRCVFAVRGRLDAARVVWIRPIRGSGPAVDLAASAFGDRVIYYRPGRDGLHPASYAAVARDVRAAWGDMVAAK